MNLVPFTITINIDKEILSYLDSLSIEYRNNPKTLNYISELRDYIISIYIKNYYISKLIVILIIK